MSVREGREHVWKVVLTLFEIVVETDANFTFRVGGHCQPCLSLHAFFPQVDILLRARVHDFDVRPLIGTRTDVCCDNYEGVIVGRVPQTFLLWPPVGWQVELDCIRWKDEREEGEEEREPEETRHGEV